MVLLLFHLLELWYLVQKVREDVLVDEVAELIILELELRIGGAGVLVQLLLLLHRSLAINMLLRPGTLIRPAIMILVHRRRLLLLAVAGLDVVAVIGVDR